jgi:bifunctional DNA-binding transcriptional regulator/antitoxin component of YhaV-PrlF toxin-antitoxin module
MAMSTQPRRLRMEVDGEENRVVLPPDLREKLGPKGSDEVWVVETDEGILFMSREAMMEREYQEVDAEFRKQGLSLDDMIESGREIRAELMKERYGIAW